VDTQPDTQPDTSPSSSSSFLISENLKTTTTGEQDLLDDGRVQLAPDWDGVDFSPLTEFGFSRSHIIQLAKHGQLSAAEVQDSIHFFSFDLKRNGKGRELKGPPVNFFMGILRKGMPYAPPENYESPVDEARRRYREGLARQAEVRAQAEREILDLEFDAWKKGLSPQDFDGILPDFARRPGPIHDSTLRAHFESVVWPERGVRLPELLREERSAIAKEIQESLGEAGGSHESGL
jgi:hypothetical protein